MIKSQTDTSQNENELLVSKRAEKKLRKILKPQGHFLKDFPVSDILDISMILGFTALALFVDGLLRLLGIIPPFMQIDIDILDKVVERVETDIIDKVRQVPIQKIWPR